MQHGFRKHLMLRKYLDTFFCTNRKIINLHPIGSPTEWNGSSSPRNPARQPGGHGRWRKGREGGSSPTHPEGTLTSHHHCRIGGHLPMHVRGHRRVGCGVVKVSPGGKARHSPDGALGPPCSAPDASTAFLESGSGDLDPSSLSNLFKNNASLSSE